MHWTLDDLDRLGPHEVDVLVDWLQETTASLDR